MVRYDMPVGDAGAERDWGVRGAGWMRAFAALLLCVRAVFAAPAAGDLFLSRSEVPLHGKVELTFTVGTVATDLYWPYDPNPPSGVPPGTGVTVEAEFTPDDWATTYTVPAFYCEEFLDAIRKPDPIGNREWFYPTGNFHWKVRFAPFRIGKWRYRITLQDASGSSASDTGSFTVVPSSLKGPIRVSNTDARYLEYGDGTYFPALGYNMNWNRVAWRNPVLDNEANFRTMQANGIQFIRIWLSEWGIFSQPWTPWVPETEATYDFRNAAPGNEISVKLAYPGTDRLSPFIFQGQHYPRPTLKRGSPYRLRLRAKVEGVAGPRIPGYPFGLTVKVGEWLVPDSTEPGSGVRLTGYLIDTGGEFQEITGWWVPGISVPGIGALYNDFFPATFVTLENVTAGTAYIDSVYLEEHLGDGNYGTNVMRKPRMDYHRYIEQRNAYAFDKMLALAEQYGITLKVVLSDKNDAILGRFNADSSTSSELLNNNFYGDWRNMTKTRWLLRAWWRYAQARWGYSSSIAEWELLNEGDPYNGLHYTLADEFAKFMKVQANPHLATTSFWHSFPKSEFWANPAYPNMDTADLHSAARIGDEEYYDTALLHKRADERYGAKTEGGVGKPTIRGETGLLAAEGWDPSPEVWKDTGGIWLHNFLWAQLSPGGLIESPWFEYSHIYNLVEANFDHRPEFGKFYRFIKDIPLNNGHYVDADAAVSSSAIRAWGQKDLVNARAHLWISNRHHTWKNVVDGVPIPPLFGTVTLSGFQAGRHHEVQWWDTYSTAPSIRSEVAIARNDGALSLPVRDLVSDIAIKVEPIRPIKQGMRPPVSLRPPLNERK